MTRRDARSDGTDSDPGGPDDTGPEATASGRSRLAADGGADGPTDDRDVWVETPASYAGRYRTAYGEVPFDEPEDDGGTGSAPTPVEHLLGSLGSCFSITVHAVARRDEIPLGAIDCEVVASPESGPLSAIEMELELETDADDAAIERTVRTAERACYVTRALSAGLDVSVSWKRR